MNKLLKTSLALVFLFTTTVRAGSLQNSDFATAAQITGAGGTIAQLLNDTKIYSTVLGVQLSTAITNGTIGTAAAPFIMGQFATPANPAAGFDKLYFKADNKLYGLNSAGVEVLIGPSGGGGAFPVSDGVYAVQSAGDATKQQLWLLSGQTTGTNLTLASSNTVNRTLTFPNFTDTLAVLAGAQTFTNKTFGDAITGTQIATPANPGAGSDKLYFKASDQLFMLNSAGLETQISGVSTFPVSDTVFLVQNQAVPTKQFNLSLGGQTAATTLTLASSNTVNRTLTFPDFTDTVAVVNGAQTLAAKTLTAVPSITSATANPATAGTLRLANADFVEYRNAGNTGNLTFGPGSSDAVPEWNGIDLVNLSTAQTLTNKSMDGGANTFTNIPNSALVSSYLTADGTTPLTGNWNAGAFSITANSVVIGGAAHTISSVASLTSSSANPAASGVLRLSNTDALAFRNAGNTADLLFEPGSSNAIPQYNAIDLVNLSTAQTLTNKTMSGATNTFSNIPDGALSTPYIKADGTRPLTGSWNAGAFDGIFNSVDVGSAANTISGLSTINNGGNISVPNAADTMALLAATQTFTNKTFGDAITGTQIATPANPAAGFDKLYFKADDNLYILNSAGTEVQLSTGSGAPTIYQWTGYSDNGCGGWPRTVAGNCNSQWCEMNGDATCVFTSVSNTNFGAITPRLSSAPGGGFNTATVGFAFTAPATGTYHVCVNTSYGGNGNGDLIFIRSRLGSGTIISSGAAYKTATNIPVPITLCGNIDLTATVADSVMLEIWDDTAGIADVQIGWMGPSVTGGQEASYSIQKIN